MKKILAYINPMNWVEGFMLSKFLQKVVTGVVTTVVGLAITPKIVELFTALGVSVDVDKLKAYVVTALVGLILGALNTAKHGAKSAE